uniref:Uncharacterized protein n=1 Tax=Oryza brachyantha TaxID=4533 RepID=J3MPZ2_ORYBR
MIHSRMKRAWLRSMVQTHIECAFCLRCLLYRGSGSGCAIEGSVELPRPLVLMETNIGFSSLFLLLFPPVVILRYRRMRTGVTHRNISWAAETTGEVTTSFGFEKSRPKTHSYRDGTPRRPGRRFIPLANTTVELSRLSISAVYTSRSHCNGATGADCASDRDTATLAGPAGQ